MRKSPKNLPEGVTPSGYSPWGALSSPQQRGALLPPERGATPGSTQATKQLPRHGLTAESVTPGVAWGEKKTDLPTNLKWQIGLFLWLKPYRGGCGAAAGGAKRPPQGVQGRSPGAPLVTFPATGKSPGVEGRSALPIGAVGAGGPHFGERRGGRQPSSQRDLAHRLAKVTPFRYNERKYFLLSRRKTTWEQKNRENKNLIE